MSSYTISNLLAQGITIGPERFLAKPFSVEQLLQQVASALAAPAMRIAAPAAPASAKDVQWFD
jgi:CheY-like chemotaxis protein